MVTAGVAGARGTTLGGVVDVVDVVVDVVVDAVVDVLVEVVVGVAVDVVVVGTVVVVTVVVVIGTGDGGAAVTGGAPTPGSRSGSWSKIPTAAAPAMMRIAARAIVTRR